MNTEKMKEVFSDEAFVKSLFAMETAAEVQSALKEKGIEMSEEEILSVRELLGKVENGEINQAQLGTWQKQAGDGELSNELLEHIAAGYNYTGVGIGLMIPEDLIGKPSPW
ncbi:MAG: Nif11-like leader peptide family natural product precursor [Clostridia bacterium]|nr:Nif11-like leader peptide family natural product precursor [Clostridia bacterium]